MPSGTLRTLFRRTINAHSSENSRDRNNRCKIVRRSMRSVSGIVDKSIAVLPFENLSRDPDNAFFTDGVQDEILTDLAKIADLNVMSRTYPQARGECRRLLPLLRQRRGQ
jgi:TolB-like protein